MTKNQYENNRAIESRNQHPEISIPQFSISQVKQELMKISKCFYDRGWMLGTSGNLSVLTTEPKSLRVYEPKTICKNFQFLITVSGKDKGLLLEDNFVLVNEDAENVEGGMQNAECIPSAETLLHSAIYKHTDAKAVFHVHTTNSTLLSMKPLEGQDKSCPYISFSGLEMLKGLGFETHDTKITIPIIENSQDMKYLSEILPTYINEQDIPGFLLKGHGLYAWGKSIQETKRHVEVFEFLFEYRIKELSLVF